MPALKLRATASSTPTKKVLVAAHTAGVKVDIDSGAVVKSWSGREVPELLNENGELLAKYCPAILRYVARVMSNTLYGQTYFDASQVDQWLDFTENEIDCVVEAKGCPSLGDHLEVIAQKINQQMQDRTYITGHVLTVADISMACSLYAPLVAKESAWQKKFPALYRWLHTCAHQPAFVEVYGTPAAALAAAPVPARAQPASSAKAPTQANGPVSAAPAPSSASAGALTIAAPAAHVTANVPEKSYGGRTRIAAMLLTADKGKSKIGQTLAVCGWSRTVRKQGGGKFCFVEVNDGSCQKSLQVVVTEGVPGYDKLLKCGAACSFKFVGEVVESPGANQPVELAVKDPKKHSMTIYGESDPATYPLAKKQHSMEFLREIGHLRPRTNIIGSVARLRSAMAMATHRFFQDRGFLYVHTPIITASDCEGAGEMFQVTTILPNPSDPKAPQDLPKDPKTKMIDYSKDFFGRPAFLTVSGQLAVENYSCALSDVYTFGPTFRAENSHTSRHLAEFWMIEPELSFADIKDDMECAEAYIKFCVNWALDNNLADLEFLASRGEKDLIDRLKNIVAEPFGKVTYTEAIELLKPQAGRFENKDIHWGMDLASEHERWLAEQHFKKPVIVYNYPKDIKAFYMRLNDDKKTVAAMDVLLPKIGEVIGGSQREERLEVLDMRIKEMNLDINSYWWYRDLRKYGTVPHAGFGLGFERLLMLVTGIESIRDVIPYPRYPGRADF